MHIFQKILLVGLGGFIGAASRFATTEFVHKITNAHWFPFGTLVANVLGCFLIGLVGGHIIFKGTVDEGMRLFFVVGILGGFTTFSNFSHETLHLFHKTESLAAYLNVLFTVVLCLTAAWIGQMMVK